MENTGAITYREALLLVDEKESSLATKQRVAQVISHELSHQWRVVQHAPIVSNVPLRASCMHSLQLCSPCLNHRVLLALRMCLQVRQPVRAASSGTADAFHQMPRLQRASWTR